MHIQQLFDLYQNDRLPSSASVKNYKSLLNLYQKDNNISSIHITHEQVIKWRNQILDRASPRTWNSYLAQLRALFNFGVECGFINENIFTKVRSVPCHVESKKTLSQQQINQALKICEPFNNSWFLVILIKTFYFTGMRRKQLVGLKWKHIDFDKKTITLHAFDSKTKVETIIPINPKLEPYLLLLAKKNKYCHVEKQVFDINLYNSRSITNELTVEQVSYIFRRISNHLDFKITPHRLRHTMASIVANNGGNIRALQQTLGHKSITTTMGYVNPSIKEMKEIQNLL